MVGDRVRTGVRSQGCFRGLSPPRTPGKEQSFLGKAEVGPPQTQL